TDLGPAATPWGTPPSGSVRARTGRSPRSDALSVLSRTARNDSQGVAAGLESCKSFRRLRGGLFDSSCAQQIPVWPQGPIRSNSPPPALVPNAPQATFLTPHPSPPSAHGGSPRARSWPHIPLRTPPSSRGSQGSPSPHPGVSADECESRGPGRPPPTVLSPR